VSGAGVEGAAQTFLKIFVADLDRSAAFYADALGFVPGARFAVEAFEELVLRPGQGVRGGSLVLCRWRDGRPLELGNAHGPIGLKVADVDAAHDQVLAAGGVSRVAPLAIQSSRLAIVHDPDGHALELIAFGQSEAVGA
jgi:catechol 2,3-dioxygenase-like lactoylglutathione lyase family enzyme